MLNCLGLFLSIWLGAPATAPAESPRIAPPQLDALLAQLADPRYETREDATNTLCQLSEGDLPQLYQRYRAENRYEIKRRIRYIIESIFHRDQLRGRDGFMGIQVYLQTLSDLTDPQNGPTTRGVIVKDVKPGFAAESAGVKANDIIIGLQGEPVPDDSSPASFVQRVGSRPPGSILTLRILRAEKTKGISLKGGAESANLLKAVHVVVASDISSPPVYCINVVDADSDAARAGFRPNQLLKSINGMAPGGNSLDAIARGVSPQTELVFEVADTQVMTIKVRLGRRPPEFADPKDHLEAQARFIRWWQEQGGDAPPRQPVNMLPRVAWNVAPMRRLGPETTLQP